MSACPRKLLAAPGKLLLVGLAVLSVASTAQAHQGGLGNAVMWQACEGRKVDESCVFQSLDHDVFRGSCQAMASALMCVRNQPIERAANGSHSHAAPGADGSAPDSTPMAARRPPWRVGGLALLACALVFGLIVGLARFKRKRKAAA